METICGKLFTKVVALTADGQSGVIELRDTAGSSLQCNYIRVAQNRSIATVGYVYVQPSGAYFLQGLQFDPSGTTLAGSGCGGFVVGPNESFDYLSPTKFSSIGYKFSQSGGTIAGTSTIMVTYGLVTQNNPLKGFGPNTGR